MAHQDDDVQYGIPDVCSFSQLQKRTKCEATWEQATPKLSSYITCL